MIPIQSQHGSPTSSKLRRSSNCVYRLTRPTYPTATAVSPSGFGARTAASSLGAASQTSPPSMTSFSLMSSSLSRVFSFVWSTPISVFGAHCVEASVSIGMVCLHNSGRDRDLAELIIYVAHIGWSDQPARDVAGLTSYLVMVPDYACDSCSFNCRGTDRRLLDQLPACYNSSLRQCVFHFLCRSIAFANIALF